MYMNCKILETAFGEYGTHEIVGDEDNPRILQYFKEIGHSWVKSDETAWCSAFANWVCLKSGKERSGKLNARSWLDVGVDVKEPVLGDIVVFWRESRDSWKGHVAFFINEDDNYIWVLGGNQNNTVKISAYPKTRLLSYRRLSDI